MMIHTTEWKNSLKESIVLLIIGVTTARCFGVSRAITPHKSKAHNVLPQTMHANMVQTWLSSYFDWQNNIGVYNSTACRHYEQYEKHEKVDKPRLMQSSRYTAHNMWVVAESRLVGVAQNHVHPRLRGTVKDDCWCWPSTYEVEIHDGTCKNTPETHTYGSSLNLSQSRNPHRYTSLRISWA